jgi:metal-responsive CopG/Arc/MetJ family transcriptional regulator
VSDSPPEEGWLTLTPLQGRKVTVSFRLAEDELEDLDLEVARTIGISRSEHIREAVLKHVLELRTLREHGQENGRALALYQIKKNRQYRRQTKELKGEVKQVLISYEEFVIEGDQEGRLAMAEQARQLIPHAKSDADKKALQQIAERELDARPDTNIADQGRMGLAD